MRVALNALLTLSLLAGLLAAGSYSPRMVYAPGYQLHRTVTECHRCHQPWQPVANASCAGGVCHVGLLPSAKMKTAHQHYHALLRQRDCRGCHPEHKGEQQKARFQHGQIPIAAAARCDRCHAQPPPVLSGGKQHPPPRRDDCVVCHVSDTHWRKVVLPKE